MFSGIFSLLLVVVGFFALLFMFLKSINVSSEGSFSDKNRKNSKKIIDKKTQSFLKDLENEAYTEAKYKKMSRMQYNENMEGGLMNKVKRLKSLYNNGTLTKAEFEKAKNKLLK